MTAKRQIWLTASLLFILVFFLYLKTLCASLYLDDSGETATLAWTFSIGHPPGYPFHTLLAHLFSMLPLGDPALRINLFAALLGAVCAPLTFFCARKFSNGTSAIFAAVLLCFGPIFWHQALVAKGSVYMLNNTLTMLLLVIALYLHGKKRIQLFFLILGISLAHHYMSQVVLLPCYAFLLKEKQWRSMLKQSLWILPGISLYLVLPLRSAQNPPINWGEMHNLGDFIFFLSRAQYAAGELSRTFATSAAELVTALHDLCAEGRWMAWLLALLGFISSRRNALHRGLFLGILVPVAAVTIYLNLEAKRLNIIEPYLFPAYLCQALLAASGLAWVLEHFSKPKKIAFVAMLALAFGIPVASSYASQDLSDYFYATDNARNTLSALPRHAVLFSAGDAIIFPLWYLQDVKQERRDVALVGTPVLPMEWVRHSLQSNYPDFLQPTVMDHAGAESIDPLVQEMLELNEGHLPLYFSYNQMNPGIHSWKLVPEGEVFQALRSNQSAPADSKKKAESDFTACINRGFESSNIDPTTLLLIVHDRAIQHNSLGTWLEDQKDFRGALQHYLLATALDPKKEDFPFNVGNALNELDKKEESLAWYERSIRINPLYESAWFNLAATNFMLNHNSQGCAALRKTLEIDPHNQDALAQLGRCQNLQ